MNTMKNTFSTSKFGAKALLTLPKWETPFTRYAMVDGLFPGMLLLKKRLLSDVG